VLTSSRAVVEQSEAGWDQRLKLCLKLIHIVDSVTGEAHF
jgi:hypothetical protein